MPEKDRARNRPRGRPRSTDPAAQTGSIRTLDRALDVLDVLARGHGLTLSEVSASLEQSPATVHRILSTLERRAMVEGDPAGQSWRIGPAAYRIGTAFLRAGGGVMERSRPVMRGLMEATGETVNLGFERGGMVLFVGQVETHHTIRAFFPPGAQSPMHASGVGKALLSRRPALLDALLWDVPLERFTEHTITGPDALRRDIEAARARGFAFDDEERTPGMRCIAAPIIDAYGEAVAGISISGPVSRVARGDVGRFGGRVAAAAAEISRGLGASEEWITAAVATPCDD